MDEKEILIPGFDVGVPLYTRAGDRVPTSKANYLSGFSAEEMDKINQKSFPNIKRRSLDPSYNCMGMVFAFRRAWVEPKHISRLLAEDEYYEVCRIDTVPGDLIAYYVDKDRQTLTHIGIIVAKRGDIEKADWNIQVLSKWGLYGEYLHDEGDVPNHFGNLRIYYSERK